MTYLTQIVTSGADDGNSSGGVFDSGSIVTGANPTAAYGGVRFQSVAIPQAALITSATMTLLSWAGVGGGGTTWGKWFGEAADSAAAWSSSARPDQRTKTTAFCPVQWNSTNNTFLAHDVTAIIQEIVNRAGWSSGNALAIVGDGVGDGFAIFKELNNNAYATPLVISFVSPAGGGSTGRGGAMAGAALAGDASQTLSLTNLMTPRSRDDAGQRCWANWLFDRVIYRGPKGKARAYLGVKSEAQMYLGERKLF